MATVTLSSATLRQPEVDDEHVAACWRVSLSVSESLSVGDIHRIGKLPHGAIPFHVVWYPGPASADGTVLKIGTSASQEMFFASATYSVAAGRYVSGRRLGTQMQISLSDDAMPRYEYITMVGTAGVSVGYVGELFVTYKLPGPTF